MCKGAGFMMRDVTVDHPEFGRPVPCQHPVHTEQRMKRLHAISGLSGSDLDIRLEQIEMTVDNQEMLTKCREMIDDPRGWLYIWGGPGNAKTVALMAMVNEINEQGRGPAMYVKFSALINWMRDSYREQKQLDNDPYANLGYIQRFNSVKSIRFLAIDELDKVRETGFADEFRFDFLDERYNQACKEETMTVFASNVNPATLPPAIHDRIRDGRFNIVENKQGSGRPVMGWDNA